LSELLSRLYDAISINIFSLSPAPCPKQYLFIFQLHIADLYVTAVGNIAHSIAAHPGPRKQKGDYEKSCNAFGTRRHPCLLCRADGRIHRYDAALKADPAGDLKPPPPASAAPSNTALNFTVADAKGLL
jgi:hypothetical protein